MEAIVKYALFLVVIFSLILITRKIMEQFAPSISKNKYLSVFISASVIVAIMQFIIIPNFQSVKSKNENLNQMKTVTSTIKRVILAHAWPADAQTAWYPEVKKQLEEKGIEVIIPPLPNPENSSAEDWIKILQDTADKNSENTLLIGHSIGGTAVLRMLEQTDKKFAGLIMVSTAGFDLGYPALKDFFEGEFDYNKINSNTSFVTTFYSPNDVVLAPDPVKHASVFLKNLNAKTIILNERGHFAPFDNCTDIPELLQEITNRR
ncbi:RBBP9/YdeN family alpha/beta hydrolase [Tenacibaculum amylolyticum]|uniref:RBBP9/YdeN family alpha/beta hydrolase n=1 Tax=Tenacibaculum amylolyticum TaxID=104269 RepID=UPI0038935B7F